MVSRSYALPQRVYSTGMLIAVGAILMFFAALASAWVVRRGFAPAGVEAPVELPRRLLVANTGLLMASSLTMEVARRRLKAGWRCAFRFWWLTTLGLGIAFVGGQAGAWRRLAESHTWLASTPDASFFYVFTGAHAAHLLGGIAGIAWIAWRRLPQMASQTAVRVCSVYWHFLTLVWLAILILLLGAF